LFAGKRCLHVDIPGTPFSHFAIRSGLISQCLSRQEVEAYLLQHSQRSVDIAALYEKSGILPHATGKYRNYLKALAEDLSNEQQFKTNNSNQCLLPNRK
jgi:hypothetical protein